MKISKSVALSLTIHLNEKLRYVSEFLCIIDCFLFVLFFPKCPKVCAGMFDKVVGVVDINKRV